MRLTATITLIAAMVWFTGCQTFLDTTVTVTKVADLAMQSWATAHNDGLTTPELDRKVLKAHIAYRDAAATAESALLAYQENKDTENYLRVLNTLKASLRPMLDLVAQVIAPDQAAKLKDQLAKASKP